MRKTGRNATVVYSMAASRQFAFNVISQQSIDVMYESPINIIINAKQ